MENYFYYISSTIGNNITWEFILIDRTISGESYLNHEKCGIVRNDNGDAISDRIFGGGNVTLGLFPWIARIGYKVKNSIQFKYEPLSGNKDGLMGFCIFLDAEEL